MQMTLEDGIVITDYEGVIERIEQQSGYKVDYDVMRDFILNEENTHFYFNIKMQPMTRQDDDELLYLWADTGYVDSSGCAIFISFIKQTNLDNFEGCYVGNYRFLSKTIASYNPKYIRYITDNRNRFDTKYEKKIEKRTIKHIKDKFNESKIDVLVSEQHFDNVSSTYSVGQTAKTLNETGITEVTKEIYNNLAYPRWKSINGLERYLKIIGKRLSQMIERDKTEYFVLNSSKYAIVNTGVMNQFGDDFLVLYRPNFSDKFKDLGGYEVYKIIHSKSDYLENGFEKEQTRQDIKPIKFYSGEMRNFAPTLEDFDLDAKDLSHIIEERRDRFPESISDLSNIELTRKLRSELEMGIKMQLRDSTYAKLYYSAKTGKCAWLFPFHVSNRLIDAPELMMVITKSGEFYKIKTILPYDDEMKDKITGMSLYSNMW